MDQRIYYRNYTLLHNTEINQAYVLRLTAGLQFAKTVPGTWSYHKFGPSTLQTVRHICYHQINKMWVPKMSVKISHLYPRKDAAAAAAVH
jgi:hypothetical protein